MVLNYVCIYNNIIQKQLQNKIDTKEKWENEFGIIHKISFVKEQYNSQDDFKISYHTINNTVYFKVLPKYFSLPDSHAYWEYYDGCIKDNEVHWTVKK